VLQPLSQVVVVILLAACAGAFVARRILRYSSPRRGAPIASGATVGGGPLPRPHATTDQPRRSVSAHDRSGRLTVFKVFVSRGERTVSVATLLRALRDEARTVDQAQAALGALWVDGVIDLQPVEVRTTASSPLYLRGPQGVALGIATLALSLDAARAEVDRARSESLAPVALEA
jgi:hypothetical protein